MSTCISTLLNVHSVHTKPFMWAKMLTTVTQLTVVKHQEVESTEVTPQIHGLAGNDAEQSKGNPHQPSLFYLFVWSWKSCWTPLDTVSLLQEDTGLASPAFITGSFKTANGRSGLSLHQQLLKFGGAPFKNIYYTSQETPSIKPSNSL